MVDAALSADARSLLTLFAFAHGDSQLLAFDTQTGEGALAAQRRLRWEPDFDPKATVSVFTPQGDIIAGKTDGSLVRYCRSSQ